jgi:hypothetical protein
MPHVLGRYWYAVTSILFFQVADKNNDSWSAKKIGCVRTQLFETREIIGQQDKAQESRDLTDDELDLRRRLKRVSLVLPSLARTIA